ncbi:MAG TPA: redoxin domain-containing protein [Fimbriimonadaceae bacterium]|nr:redoxin domain-containing protein [Fimbriimonadaceae bacterium]HRJ97106.1 redoxin domain-containing protein [Fimbriimonadaceae bacterium]
MKKTLLSMLGLATLGIALSAWATQDDTATSKMAPEFSVASSSGKDISLGQFKGKYVVLEWWNHQCPFVVRHYGGNMQALQKQMKDDGVVWLTVCSSAPGKQGHVSVEQANEIMKENGGSPAFILLDADGKVGKLFGAKTTPQMVLISPKGEVLYNGGIDNAPNARTKEDMAQAENFVLKAYKQAKAGQPITNPAERPYGCGVKY